MGFKDKNNININIGDVIRPNDYDQGGRDCLILSIAYNSDIGEIVMYGQQLQDSRAFSLFTMENLSNNWEKVIV